MMFIGMVCAIKYAMELDMVSTAQRSINEQRKS